MAHPVTSNETTNGLMTPPTESDNLPLRPQSHLQADWAQPKKHSEALTIVGRVQSQLNNLRSALPALLYPLAYQTSDKSELSSSPAAVYSAFEEAALRLKAGINELRASYESEEVRDVLRRVEQRESGLATDGVFGDLERMENWEIVVGRPRRENGSAANEVAHGATTRQPE